MVVEGHAEEAAETVKVAMARASAVNHVYRINQAIFGRHRGDDVFSHPVCFWFIILFCFLRQGAGTTAWFGTAFDII